MNWEKYYNAYKVNEEMIWLNNCGTTPANKWAVEDVQNYLEGYSRKGIFSDVQNYVLVKKRITKILAELIKCSEDEIGLIHNTSEGMNFISHELDLKSGDEILLLENEYPSNVYPFEHWKAKGIKIDFIPLAENPEKLFQNFVTKVNKNTKLVSVSLVHWCTGMPLPIKKMGDYCKEMNIEFIIDGAQGVGLVDIDVQKMNISAMAFPAWKWLLGPLGLGIIFVAKKNLEKRTPIFKGQNSVINADEYLPYKSDWKKGADRYEYSTSSMTDWVYFQASLNMLFEIGFETVQNRIYELADYFASECKEIGFEVLKDSFTEKTGIVSINKSNLNLNEVISILKKENIICALRLGRLRFAPHIYNSKEQLYTVVNVLKKNL